MNILAKVKRTILSENGKWVEKKEQYLVDALSLNEAIELVYKHFDGKEGIDVNLVGPTNYNEIISEEGEYFFKVKCYMLTIDEKTGVEKKTPFYILLQADNIFDAVEKSKKHIEGFISDVIISSVSETKIIDYITSID